MALYSRSFCFIFFALCLATPLFASPLFFNIFNKNRTRAATTTTTASPNNFDIDFSISSGDEPTEQNFVQRMKSTVRLVSALLKSFITVITNRNERGDDRSLDELATEDTLAGFDPFGVEPSENEIDFFATLDEPSTSSGTSSGRSLDSRPSNSSSPTSDQSSDPKESNTEDSNDQETSSKPDATPSDQSVDTKVESESSSPSEASKFTSPDVRKAVLIGSARHV